MPEAQQPVARHLVEDLLIKDGVRLPFAERALLAERGVTRDLLDGLTAASLLRVERDEQGRMLYEVGHDTLVAPIGEAAKARREGEERERLQREAEEQREALRREAERQAEEKRKIARARRNAILVGIGALLLLVYALLQSRQATQAKREAEEAKAEAVKMTALAGQRDSLARQAQTQADTAQHIATRKTEEARQSAEANAKTMLQLGYSTAQVVDALVKEVNGHIYRLEYPDALGNLEGAARFNKRTIDFTHAALELAFYYNEVGERQSGVLVRTLALLGQPRPRSQVDCRDYLRGEDRLWYSIMMEKYYPVMVDVAGGEYYPGCVKPADCEITDSSYRARVDKLHLARTETTFHQYSLFCEATGRDIFKDCGPLSWGFNGDNPVVNVSWFDACLYANWLSQQFGKQEVYKMGEATKGDYGDDYPAITLDSSANGYRLPTEAEWEWAARGGTKQDTFDFSGNSIIENVAWYSENSKNRTQAVATKNPNALRLYDLSGNVWEWCWDWYDTYPTEAKTDWRGPDKGDTRVVRGGGWYGDPQDCRVAYRYYYSPTYRLNCIGFRLARSF